MSANYFFNSGVVIIVCICTAYINCGQARPSILKRPQLSNTTGIGLNNKKCKNVKFVDAPLNNKSCVYPISNENDKHVDFFNTIINNIIKELYHENVEYNLKLASEMRDQYKLPELKDKIKDTAQMCILLSRHNCKQGGCYRKICKPTDMSNDYFVDIENIPSIIAISMNIYNLLRNVRKNRRHGKELCMYFQNLVIVNNELYSLLMNYGALFKLLDQQFLSCEFTCAFNNTLVQKMLQFPSLEHMYAGIKNMVSKLNKYYPTCKSSCFDVKLEKSHLFTFIYYVYVSKMIVELEMIVEMSI